MESFTSIDLFQMSTRRRAHGKDKEEKKSVWFEPGQSDFFSASEAGVAAAPIGSDGQRLRCRREDPLIIVRF